LNSIDLMKLTQRAKKACRTPFVPSIYEHGAAVLGKSPGEVSRDSVLTAQAAIESHRRYDHDLVTVGIDIYNVEAEAWGCAISDGKGTSVPGVTAHPLANSAELDAEQLQEPQPGQGNRLLMLADAVEQVVSEIGDSVWVYACMGGPFSQAVELRGFDNLVVDIYTEPKPVHALLEKATHMTLEHARRLSEKGAGVYLYESWATMPLITADMFRDYVTPYNKVIVEAIKSEYSTPRPSVVMGGDITVLGELFIDIGVALIAADFLSDFGVLREKFDGTDTIIRGCVDPKMIERGDWDGLQGMVDQLAEKSEGMHNFVWGCGCVSYNTPEKHLLRFKSMCAAARPSS